MIRNKYLGVLAGTIILVANLPGCGAGAAHRATSNPDGSRFTDEQIWEREVDRGELGFEMDRKAALRMSDQYVGIAAKKYVAAFHRLATEVGHRDQGVMLANAGPGLGDALDYVNIGMHLSGAAVLGPAWLSVFDGSGSGVKRSLLSSSINSMYRPYMEIIRAPGLEGRITTVTEDSRMDLVFEMLDGFVRNGTPLPCEISDHWKGGWARGKYAKGLFHSRYYFCDPKRSKPADNRAAVDATLFVYKAGPDSALKELVAPGELLASITFNDLNKLPGWNGSDAAQRLYGQIRQQLDSNWYTVFTGPDDAGDWKVFVAKGNKIVAFDPPPKS